MRVILFGATGMVGQGVLRECLLDPTVDSVLSIVRRAASPQHAKLRELVHTNFLDYEDVRSELSNFDACFFCLGVTSAGMNEANYRVVTCDYALAAARVLAELNSLMTFVFISGQGADSTGKSRTMWARVKGEAENALQRLPFKAVYCIRPGVIQPLHGITSRTAAYRILYTALAPVLPFLLRQFPAFIITTEQLGKAMIRLARFGGPKTILENGDIHQLMRQTGV